jgi:hypothetical protein
MHMEFGFTNDSKQHEAAVAFRTALVADGWSVKQNDKTDDTYTSHYKDGWCVQILSRNNVGKWKHEASVNAWGPDGMSVKVPTVYNFEAMKAGLRRCGLCNAEGVDTQRYSFAGRCCAKCIDGARAKFEKPGWCD